MSKWILPRATTAERGTITPDDGEILYDETLSAIYTGDGITVGGNPLSITSSSAWGSITGTLTDQSDLNSALNGKANSSHTHEASNIISGTLDNARISESSVTQHQGALSINVSQIVGLNDSIDVQFETVSKNLSSWDATLNYTTGTLTSVVYTDGVDTITKTLNYTTGTLTSVVLSGDTPAGIDLTKTLTYTGSDLTGIAYS